MKKLVMAIGVLMLSVASMAAQSQKIILEGGSVCNCTKVPFKPDPPCFDKCWAALLAESTEECLRRDLNIDPRIVDGILAHRDGKPKKLAEYETILGSYALKQLKKSLERVTQSQLDKFLSR